MKTRYLSIAAALVTLVVVNTADAQASRTWVSGVGDDANPCSRTAPCKTFAGAISKTARSGEITVLDPGGYGSLSINKSITVNGGGVRGSILHNGFSGISVNITDASDPGVVNLQGLDLTGGGSGTGGIRFFAGKQLNLRDCTITGNVSNGIAFTPASNAALLVTNTTITNNTGHGVLVRSTAGVANVALDKVTLSGNALTGIRAEDGARVTARECTASANNNGYVAVSTSAATELNIDNCVASGNNAFGVASVGASSIIRISHSVVTNNNTGLSGQSGGQVISYLPSQTNRVEGNTPGGDGAATGLATQK